MKNILVTGGLGFIGSNFIPYFLDRNKDIRIINLDKLTYAANPNNLKEVEGSKNYKLIKGDISNRDLVSSIFKDFDISSVIHLAAESHVDRSITDPEIFIDTNIKGTFILIDEAKKHWMDKPFNYKASYKGARFLHVSTDEVYGEVYDNSSFTESSPYAPNSPYSASKAASDHIVRSFHKTYGLDTVITRSSNNYGPKQDFEKLIPKVIKNALSLKAIPVYAKGENIRDWLYVLDHCSALNLIFKKAKPGDQYNVGTRNQLRNIDLVKKICEILDSKRPRRDKLSYQSLISFVGDRLGHDFAYAVDPSKLEAELGWKGKQSFDLGLSSTIDWYLKIL